MFRCFSTSRNIFDSKKILKKKIIGVTCHNSLKLAKIAKTKRFTNAKLVIEKSKQNNLIENNRII